MRKALILISGILVIGVLVSACGKKAGGKPEKKWAESLQTAYDNVSVGMPEEELMRSVGAVTMMPPNVSTDEEGTRTIVFEALGPNVGEKLIATFKVKDGEVISKDIQTKRRER